MMDFFKKHLYVLVISLIALAYITITLPALFQTNHFLANLEPYPDGMLYALSARNFAGGGNLALTYREAAIPIWVPPLYAITLIPGYLMSQAPQMFYFSNVLFGVASLLLLIWIIFKSTQSWMATSFAGLLYLTHAYVLWLPSVPMAENISLLLFTAAIAALYLPKKFALKHFTLVATLAVLLILTKYATVFPAIALVVLAGYRMRSMLTKKKLTIIAIIGSALVGVFWLIVQNPFTLALGTFNTVLASDNPFFGLRFVLPNIISYTKALTISGPFLWLLTPLTSVVTVAGFIATIVLFLSDKQGETHWRATNLIILFLAQFPLQLVFYTVDTRYVIFSIPLLVLGISWLFAHLTTKYRTEYLVLGAILFLIGHTLFQLPLYREVLAANLLGKSTAWQHQAILHFDQSLPAATDDAFIITALPPFLVDSYTEGQYRVLPLSTHQEFVAKGEWVWGSDVDPRALELTSSTPQFEQDQLYQLADHLLSEGKTVYISNAYITHLHEVVSDYEAWLNQYSLEPISSGCDNACNLMKLTQK